MTRPHLLASLLGLGAFPAGANPTGGTVVSGTSTSISGEGTSLVKITSSDQRSIIHWDNFSNSAGEVVRFDLPTSAVSLNRVTGPDRSVIGGRIEGTGHVMLVNPNGISITSSGVVDLTSFTATTANILDRDFLNGNYHFKLPGNPNAGISNAGTINVTEAGLATLAAPTVRNSGEINARLGRVTLAAGDTFSLDFIGDGLLSFQVDNATAGHLLSQNTGRIQADGGRILMTAAAAVGTLDSLVANSGTLQARTVRQNADGSIELLGNMHQGRLEAGGLLDASAPDGGDGGFIDTSAAYIRIADDIRVTTAASQGKTGLWLIDPLDFTIAAGSDVQTTTGIGASTLSSLLGSNNITIQNAPGVGNGDIFVKAAVNWSSNTTLTLNASRNIYVQANISNSGTGSGSGIVLTTGPAGWLSGSGGIASNGTLTINNAADGGDYSGNITGSGRLEYNGPGRLRLSGFNNYTGPTLVNGGTLVFESRNALYNATPSRWTANNILVKDGATLALAAGSYSYEFTQSDIQAIAGLGSATGGFLSGSSLGIDIVSRNISFTYSNAITNPNGGLNAIGLTKLGDGTLTLSGTNSYTGKTRVVDGVLELDKRAGLYNGNAAHWTADNITVLSGATLALNLGGSGEFTADDLQTLTGLGTATSGFLSGATISLDAYNAPGRQFHYAHDIANPNGGANALGVKIANGTVTLSGNNSYTGNTTIANSSKLVAGSSGAISSNSAVILNGTLDLNGHSLALGSLESTYNPATGNRWIGTLTTTGGPATVTIGGLNTSTEYAGSLEDGGGGNKLSLVKQGSGTLDLETSQSAYSGSTTINVGTLQVSNGAALGYDDAAIGDENYTGNIRIAAGATLDCVSCSQTFSGAISGAGEFFSHSRLKLSGINTFSGKTTVENGILTFVNRSSLYNGDATQWTADRITVSDKATLALGVGTAAGKFSAADVQALSGLGTATGGFLSGSFIGLDTSAGHFTQDLALTNPNGGVNALGLRVLGTNTLTLTAANTYSGATFVDEGTLRAGAVNTFSANSAFEVDDPATLDLGGFSNVIGSLGGTNQSAWEGIVTTSSGPATLTTGGLGTSNRFGGKLQDGGAGSALSVIKTGGGSWILSGTNSYRGSTTVSGGTLEIASSSTLGNGHYAADLSIASGTALKFTSRTNQTLASRISGAGALILDSAWTSTDRRISSVLTLTGDNSAHTGKTTVSSGTLAVTNRGALYGGDTARWTSSHLSVGNFGTLALAVGDAGAGQFTPTDINTLVGVPTASGIFLPGSAIGIYAAANADIHVSSNPDAYGTDLININHTSLENLLGRTGVSLLTAPPGVAGGDGEIQILDNVTWGSNRLSLTAAGDIQIDAVMRAWGSALLDLYAGTDSSGYTHEKNGLVLVSFNSDPVDGFGNGFKGGVDFCVAADCNAASGRRSGTGILTIGRTSYYDYSKYTLIKDVTQLQAMGSGFFALAGDIDASATSGWNSGSGFRPITSLSTDFNGLGHVITDLFINRPLERNVGLFASTGLSTLVSNVGIERGNITGMNYVGALAGQTPMRDRYPGVDYFFPVTNSYSTATVKGEGNRLGGYFNDQFIPGGSGQDYGAGNFVGGLLGEGEALHSYAAGKVSGNVFVGGLIGNGFVNDGYYRGSDPVSDVKGNAFVGGLLGNGVAWDSHARNAVITLLGNSDVKDRFNAFNFNIGGLIGGGAAYDSWTDNMRLDLQLTGNNNDRYIKLWGVGGLIGGSSQGLHNDSTSLSITPDRLLYQLSGNAVAENSRADNTTINIVDNTTPRNDPHPPSIRGAEVKFVGGLLGQGYAKDSHASGALDINNGKTDALTVIEKIGGLVGTRERISSTVTLSEAAAENSSADVDLRITTGDNTVKVYSGVNYVGGLVGYGSAVNSHADGDVLVDARLTPNDSNRNQWAGGLIGFGVAANSHATGDVLTNMDQVGGLIGELSANIDNVWAGGAVSGRINVGGLVGNADGSGWWSGGAITNSYYAGPSVSGLHSIGGLVGLHIPGPATFPGNVKAVRNSHYNVDSVLINGANQVTLGGLYDAQYQAWQASGKSLDIAHYFSQDAGGYYLINNAQQLGDMLGFVDGRAAYRFKLTADIDLRDVGNGSDAPFNLQEFWAGELNGGGHILSHFGLNQETDAGGNAIIRLPNDNLGFIGYLPSNRTVTDLTLTGAATGENVAGLGGLAGANHGVIRNVTVNTQVTALVNDYGGRLTPSEKGSIYVGGLAGYSVGEINRAHHVGDVIADAGDIGNVGGLAGYMASNLAMTDLSHRGLVRGSGSYVGGLFGQGWVVSISNASAEARVSGGSYVGGLIGEGGADIIDSTFSGSVFGHDYVGGLLGAGETSISGSHAQGSATYGNTISGTGDYVGGLAGDMGALWQSGIIEHSGVTGLQIQGNHFVGGLTGQVSEIHDSHAENMLVHGHGGYVGGLVGMVYSMTSSYATAAVSAGGNYVGGLAGEASNVDRSYFIGSVTGDANNSNFVGGLLGSGYATNSFARTDNVTGHDYVGGLLGDGGAENAFADIRQVSGNDYVGGLAGSGWWGMRRTYVTGRDPGPGQFNVNGNAYVGGHTGSGSATESYSNVSVSGVSNVGGFSGELGAYLDTTWNYYDSYGNTWNKTLNPTLDGDGTDPAHQGVTGLTAAEMTDIHHYKTLDVTYDPVTGDPSATVVPWAVTDRHIAGNYDPASPDYQTMAWRIYEGHTAPLLTTFLTPLKVTVSPDSKTYDGLAYAGSTNYSLGPLGPRDGFWHPAAAPSAGVVSGLLDSTGLNAGSYALSIQNISGKGLYSSQSGGANVLGYDLYGDDSTLTIDSADLTLTAHHQNKLYGDTFTFSGNEYHVTGLVNHETVGRVDLASAGAPAAANVGNHVITIANAREGSFNPANYNVHYVDGNMAVTGGGQPPQPPQPPLPPELPQPPIVSPHQWLSFANGVAVDPERPLSKVAYDPMAERNPVQWMESYMADTGLVDPAMLSGIVEYKPMEVEITFNQYWTERETPSQ